MYEEIESEGFFGPDADDEGLKHYYNKSANIICDLDLTPFEMALYIHIKRWSGSRAFKRRQEVAKLAKQAHMSRAQVRRARERLLQLGLVAWDEVKTDEGAIQVLRICNLTKPNIDYCSNGRVYPGAGLAYLVKPERAENPMESAVSEPPESPNVPRFSTGQETPKTGGGVACQARGVACEAMACGAMACEARGVACQATWVACEATHVGINMGINMLEEEAPPTLEGPSGATGAAAGAGGGTQFPEFSQTVEHVANSAKPAPGLDLPAPAPEHSGSPPGQSAVAVRPTLEQCRRYAAYVARHDRSIISPEGLGVSYFRSQERDREVLEFFANRPEDSFTQAEIDERNLAADLSTVPPHDLAWNIYHKLIAARIAGWDDIAVKCRDRPDVDWPELVREVTSMLRRNAPNVWDEIGEIPAEFAPGGGDGEERTN